MAITTDNEKLAVIELEDYAEPGLPLSPGTLGTDDQKQLLWGYPSLDWSGAEPEAPSGNILLIRRRRRM